MRNWDHTYLDSMMDNVKLQRYTPNRLVVEQHAYCLFVIFKVMIYKI
jgi:hypothetical protein